MVIEAVPGQPYTLVLGLGRSGIGASRLIRRMGQAVLLIESNTNDALSAKAESLRSEGIAVALGVPLDASIVSRLSAAPQRVIVSPGIRWDHPALEALRAAGVHCYGEITTAWEATRPVP